MVWMRLQISRELRRGSEVHGLSFSGSMRENAEKIQQGKDFLVRVGMAAD